MPAAAALGPAEAGAAAPANAMSVEAAARGSTAFMFVSVPSWGRDDLPTRRCSVRTGAAKGYSGGTFSDAQQLRDYFEPFRYLSNQSTIRCNESCWCSRL